MNLEQESAGDNTLIHINEDYLDASNAAAFKNALQGELSGKKRIVLDLQHVNFIDSSGLGALISILKRVTGDGGELKLYGMTREVRALFELVRMHRIFEVYNSRDEALSSFRRAA